MSTSDSLMSGGGPATGGAPRPKRFAGERFGVLVFAASFSMGIWGLALKVMAPSHSPPTPAPASDLRYAVLAPSSAGDGRAKVVWATVTPDPPVAYPLTDVVPVTALGLSDDLEQPHS